MLDRLYKCCRNFPQKVNEFLQCIWFCACWTIVVIGFVLLCIAAILCMYWIAGVMPMLFVRDISPYVKNLMINQTFPCPINIIYGNVFECSEGSFSLEIFSWFIICVFILTLIYTCVTGNECCIYRWNSSIMDGLTRIVYINVYVIRARLLAQQQIPTEPTQQQPITV